MKKIILFLPFIFILYLNSNAQRIVMYEDFENSGFNSDSLPNNWFKYDVDQSNPGYPLAVWSVRDTSAEFPGVNEIYHSKANDWSKRGVSIPWKAGDPVADDWLFTDSLRIQTGDSLIFWMLYGTPVDSIIDTSYNLSPYKDSMQVHICTDQDPLFSVLKYPTLVSLDSDNVWKEFKYDLSAFNGQKIFIAFRYYMNTTVDGLWCNIDNIFVGNHSAIGIKPISGNVPKRFDLRQNYPNPFNPVTNIEFDLPKSEFVNLRIFNTLGQEVKLLVNETKPAGSYRVDFDASGLPSGTYFYRLTAGNFVKTMKMVLIK